MNVLKKKIIHLFLLISIPFIWLGWTNNIPEPGNACIEEVYRIYKGMKLEDINKGNVYINYTQITHLKQVNVSDPGLSKTNVEFIVGKNQMHYKSDEISVYMDSVDNFTVVPIRKIVFWSNSLLEKGKKERVNGFNILQDSLFSVCKLINCRQEYNVEEGYNKIVEMAPVERATKLFQYRKVVFYINTETQTIKKIYLEFLPKFEYTGIELIYNKIEKNYLKENLNSPVKKIFVSANNQLKGDYKDYKLVDNRVSSRLR
ncbi:MAG: hypothetical protein V4547_10615 [Bacteroidota bacterium]